MKPLSPTDAMFLMIEGRRQPMHVGGLHLFTLPPDAGRSFTRDFVEYLRSHDHAESPFNLYPVFKRGRWHWDEDDQFDIEHHFRHSALPKPGRIRELLALVSRLHGSALDRSRPMWEIHVIEGLRDKRIASYSKLHHALFDGVAAMRMTRTTYGEDPDERDRLPPWATPRTSRPRNADNTAAGMNPLALLKQAAGENLRIVPGVARGLWDLVRPAGDNPADITPYQAPPTMFNRRITASRRFAAQSYSMERIKAVGKAAGATLNDVVLAICAGALRDYLLSYDALPDQPLIAMVPVSVRTADGPEDGNQVSVILASLATNIADPGKRLEAIVASTQHAKSRMAKMTRLEQIAYAAAALSPMPVTTLLGIERRPPFNVVISNVPGPTKPLYWNGARLDEMYPISIPVDGQALNITLTSYCDQIGFGYTACRRSVPGMQRLLDYTERALADLEKAAA